MSTRKVDSEISILGGGLSSIYAAYKLSNRKPTLIFGEDKIGGILNGKKWKNFYIDNGCHLFDGNEEQFNFFETVGGMQRHNVTYGSYNQGILKEDIATPEISNPEQVKIVLKELQSLEKINNIQSTKNVNIKEVFIDKFGKTCGNYLSEIQTKFTGLPSNIVAGEEFDKFSVFHRVRIGNDQISNDLKRKNSYLDKIICSSLESRGLNKFQVSMYPKEFGTSGIANNVKEYLQKNSISSIKNFKIVKIEEKEDYFEIVGNNGSVHKSRKIISTLPYSLLSKLLGQNLKATPTFVNYKIIILEIKEQHALENYYVQDFDKNNSVYRSSNMGRYSNQYSDDGTTFVVAEIPYSSEEKVIDLQKIKNELIIHKILAPNTEVIDHTVYDKKNIIPINYSQQKISLPENLFSVEHNSFSMKSKFSDIDKISEIL